MRDIKFRAVKQNHRYYKKNLTYGNFIYHKYSPTNGKYINSYRVGLYEVDPCTISQFTGQTDSNHNDIYENDIIRSFDSENNPIEHLIKFIDGQFVAHQKNDCEFINNYGHLRQDWINEFEKEVISSIFETEDEKWKDVNRMLLDRGC